MSAISHIYGIINTKEGKLYIKNYYSNGKVIKFTLTNNENDNMSFSGKKESKMAIRQPNFIPLCNIRLLLKNSKELQYLRYKSIIYNEIYHKNDKNEIKRLPTSNCGFKKINKNTKIIIVDEVNQKEICFLYE
jgi:hypothetical protein